MNTLKPSEIFNFKKNLKIAYNEIKPTNIKWSEIDKTCDMFSQFYRELANSIGLQYFRGEKFIYIFKSKESF